MTEDDPMYLVEEVEQTMKWFCQKVVEPFPLEEAAKDKIMKRMITLGWLRQSEYETYKELTKKDD